MAKHGKKYMQAIEKIGVGIEYGPKKGFELLKDISQTNYDPTVECSFRLGVDPRKADQMVRGAVSLPHGIGKTMTVAAIVSGSKMEDARNAGADHVGGDELVAELESIIDTLDAIIATPDMMGKLGRLGKVLGPRGLMPNPKSGTVTMDVAKAVTEIKAGRVEYRTDRQGNVHTVLGKASFSAVQLTENYAAMLDELVRQRPASAKGTYLASINISTSASPSITLDTSKSKDLLDEDQ